MSQMNFDDHDGLPHARTDDPSTSHDAGREIEQEEGGTNTVRPKKTKHRIMKTLELAGPKTANEVGRLNPTANGLWKRVSDLKPGGLIEWTGEKRRDPETRKLGEVWALTAKGREVLERVDRGETVRVDL